MADQITIANLALAAVGARSSISSFTEGSAESIAVALFYDPIRKACLRQANWNFARKQANMTLLGSTATNQNGVATGGCLPPWQYAYAYPSDCIKARLILPPYQMSPAGVPPISLGGAVNWVESLDTDAQGNDVKIIMTNYPQPQLIYTKDQTNTELFDDQFTLAFTQILGARMSPQVNGDKAMTKQALEIGQQTITQAQVTDGNEGLTLQEHMPDWMRVRGYASDYTDGNFWEDPGFYGGGFGATFVD